MKKLLISVSIFNAVALQQKILSDYDTALD